jgi:hypothetical protein
MYISSEVSPLCEKECLRSIQPECPLLLLKHREIKCQVSCDLAHSAFYEDSKVVNWGRLSRQCKTASRSAGTVQGETADTQPFHRSSQLCKRMKVRISSLPLSGDSAGVPSICTVNTFSPICFVTLFWTFIVSEAISWICNSGIVSFLHCDLRHTKKNVGQFLSLQIDSWLCANLATERMGRKGKATTYPATGTFQLCVVAGWETTLALKTF